MPDDATHLLVLQDDAVPVDGFQDRMTAAIQARPSDVVCGFVPGFGFLKRRLSEAKRLGKPFVQLPISSFVPAVCLAYPRPVVERLLEWENGEGWPRHRGRMQRADDGLIALFCRANRIKPVATVPSLVEHRDDLPSIVRPAHHRGAHRRAALL